MPSTRVLRLVGTLLALAGLVFNLLETAWFGFHMEPSCAEEAYCNDLSQAIFVYGVLVLLIAWLRSLSEKKA
jgi:hypothetical protein